MRYFIGIDIGTTHSKAIALQSDGFIAATASAGYEAITGPDGRHELDPLQIFDAVLAVLHQVLSGTVKAGLNKDALAGIAFSSAMHSLIAVDDTGTPLTNCITWADLRSQPQAARLKATPTAKEIYQHTGLPIHPMSPLCKLIWMQETNAALHKQAAKFIGIKEYVLHRLTGRYLIDQSIATATGLFDLHTRNWYAPSLQLAGIDQNRLSNPVSTTTIITGIAKEYADLTGLPADVNIVIGASDGCLANVGSNALEPGDLSITIGTSGAVRMITDRPVTDDEGRVFNYILDEQHYVCGGPLNNGGALVEWYAQQWLQRNTRNEEEMKWFIDQAASVPAGAEGLLMLPYVRGERAPVWDAAAKGAFIGMDHRHTQAHAMRAVLEGINYSVYDIALAVKQTVGYTKNIYVSGGFIKSPQWVQWLADLLGERLLVTVAADASAMGAAIMGWIAVGELSDLSAARKFFQAAESYEPDARNHQLLQQYYKVYTHLYKSLQNSFYSLNAITATH